MLVKFIRNFDDFDDYEQLIGFSMDTLSLKDPQTGLTTAFEIRSNVVYVDAANQI